MGPHFMRLLSIYVLNLNAIYKYTYLESCLMEINLYKLDKMDLKDFCNYLRVERVGRAEFPTLSAGRDQRSV